jgi:hypothetical protein
MNTFSPAKIAFLLALAAWTASPALSLAAGWSDILKPDYKREFNPGKNFEGKSFDADKEFTIKSFPAEKTVKSRSFPEHTFRGGKTAPAESKNFVPKESALPEKSFRAGNWETSNRNFGAKEMPQKQSTLGAKESPLGGKTVPTPEPTELSKQAPQADQAAPQPRVMDEETARKLIEKLYGPMGGRGQ